MARGVKQTRWRCAHCGTEGWWVPSTHVGPRPELEHDRSDGRRCRAAEGRKVRARNIRLLWQQADGVEHFRDFASASEARDAVPADAVDWAIFEIDHPHCQGRGRTLFSSEGA